MKSALVVVLIVLVGAALLGVGVGALGVESAFLIVGLIAALAVLINPLWGLVVLAFVMPFEVVTMPFLGDATFTRLLGALVAGAWLVRKVMKGEAWGHLFRSGFLPALVVFFAFVMLSNLWSVVPVPMVSQGMRFLMWVSLSVLVIDLVRSWDDAHAILAALAAGGVVAALLVIQQYFGVGVRRAGETVAGGVNSTAFVLVSLVPVSFYLLRARGSGLGGRVLGLTLVALGSLAVTLTFSRMALLVLPLVLGLELLSGLRSGHQRGAVLILGLVAVAVGLRFAPREQLVDRVETIVPYVQQTLLGGSADVPTASGRGFHIRVAFAVFRDHPLVGAGYLNYGTLFRDQYQFEVAGADQLYELQRSPHGTLWGFLADLGLVGLSLWALCLIAVARSLLYAYRRFRGLEDMRLSPAVLLRAVTIVLMINTLYMTYEQVHTRKMFWLFLGLAVAVERVSASSVDRRVPAAVPETPALR